MAIIALMLALFLLGRFSTMSAKQAQFIGARCVGTSLNYTQGSVYESNLNLLFNNLTSKSLSGKFDTYTVGNASNKVYGLFQCREDIGADFCNKCINESTQKVFTKCPLYGEAVVFCYQCMLRYSNRDIFSVLETYPAWQKFSPENVSNFAEFGPILADAMNGVIEAASSARPYFAYNETNLTMFAKLYSFAQCTLDIDPSDCHNCLTTALSQMSRCCNASIETTVFKPSCQLRYDSISPFLNDTYLLSEGQPPNIDGGITVTHSSKFILIVAIAVCVSVGLIVIAVVSWIRLCRPIEHTEGVEGFGETEFEQYDLATLEAATGNFSQENQLGEGGFGIVYKGTLENGDHVAIKRLSGTSTQGVREFMAEASLLVRLQHRNLVKLLGFCSQGHEKLLVYEFMPWGSLDRFLFDERRRPLLDWGIRHQIIMGIARGLQYLHEDSRLTIIHRDLKPANILLDVQINPKIADFGQAKLFDVAQNLRNSSRIVGTVGYIAPEYMESGNYSNKSDVYSFGIMLLEILSGRDNRTFNTGIPIHVWRLWNDNNAITLMDPTLANQCPTNDVMRCIHIGLLCLQANVELRPTMGSVVGMLTSSDNLSQPTTPIPSPP